MANGQVSGSGLTEESVLELLNAAPEARQAIAESLDKQIAHLQRLRSMVSGTVTGRGRGRRSSAVAANITDGLGHTEAIRKALQTRPFKTNGGTAKEIRDYLSNNGHPLPAGLFHSTMNSLKKNGEVKKTGKSDKAVFKPTNKLVGE